MEHKLHPVNGEWAERAWIDEYHSWVRTTLSSQLDERTRSWLHEATLPL